ncbi:glycoside hydrolase family 99-like domain-containing protein [Salinibacterium sp.]|uniref:glycosyltransferase WbsX family protein n=2 Tax=Salinibacterium sp. TaxID=1915057 RepID=UPI00286B0E6F|nr:glycoside hydrolase family 99-like domain-containing protein [Salinibacterium sp.]
MSRPKVLAYYFPSWHRDPRNAAWFGDGWTEWKLLADAKPRFQGHRQPRVPAAGEIDESDPQVFDTQIALATEHGVNGFLFDFYWYDDGPYLNAALDDGYLHAGKRDDIEFALMWANHNLTNIFPSAGPEVEKPILKSGAIDRAAFERMAEHIIEHYFSQPSYLKVDGRPLFSIYEIGSLIEGLGGVTATREALEWFDERARAAGHAGIHLDAIVWGFEFLPGGVTVDDPAQLIDDLGFGSASSYVWIHHMDPDTQTFPTSPWKDVEDAAFAAYDEYAKSLNVAFSPNVTVGWDASPRTAQDVEFIEGPYPWIPVWDPTPAEFERGLRRAAAFFEDYPREGPILSINAWNEWTEGSSLLPDTVNGTGYLEAIKRVFGTVHQDRGGAQTG